MKKLFLISTIIALTYVSCKKDVLVDPSKVGAPDSNEQSSSHKTNSSGSVWLDFNPYVYATEFWKEGNKTYGSCFAAAVVLVESHLNQVSSISSDAVKNKNNQMKGNTNPTNNIYILSLGDMKNRLMSDGFTVSNKTTSSKTTARDVIINAIKNNEWVIALAGYLGGGIGHAYPIHAVDIVKNQDGTINEASSVIKVIDSYNGGSWQAYNGNPTWSTMYKQTSLSNFLERMRKNTNNQTIYNYYNILTVKK